MNYTDSSFLKTDKILRLTEVKLRTGLSRSSIYLYVKSRCFPPAIKLGRRSVGWLEADIQGWIESGKGGETHEKK